MKFNKTAIPDELRERAHWICWKEERRGDQLTKIPKQPDGSGANAKSNDSATWGSFEDAVDTASQHEDWGLGFVFTGADPYTAIDLDDCLTEDGSPREWLPSMEGHFLERCYIERSPSGTGLHIITRNAEPPEWWSNLKEEGREVAIFQDGRFFTFTGDAIDVSAQNIKEPEAFDEWLLHAHEAITGRLPDTRSEHEKNASSEEIDLADVISTSDFDEGRREAHPFHHSSTGSNFAVQDWSAGHWNCYSSSCSGGKSGITGGNAAHLLGVKLDVWECGEWHDRAFDSDDWSEFYETAREAGYEVGDPDYDPEEDPSEKVEETIESGRISWAQVREFYKDQQIPDKHARQAAAARLLEEYEFAAPTDTETLWIYNEDTGVYQRQKNAPIHIESILAKNLQAHFSQHEKREIVGKVKAATYITRSQFNANAEDPLICVENGVLNLQTRELEEHSPDYLFTRGLPVEYDAAASANNIDGFLDDIVERDDERQTLLEMLGATLWPTYLKGKFAIYFGEGANGKSTWFDVQEAFLGEEHVTGWDLQRLSENRFSTAELVGKFANIAPDMPARQLNELGTLKTLTGGDTTMAERKGENAFEFVNRATLMFGANRPPVIPEASHAIKRRLVPVRFPNQFTNEPDDGNPDARDKDAFLRELTEEVELSGLLNMALDGLDRMRSSGDVSLAKSFDERLEYYEQFSDPIKEFRVRCLENDAEHRVRKTTVYEAFKNFCQENGYATRDGRVFWKMLKKSTLTVDEHRPLIDGEQERVLRNVRFTEVGARYAPSSMALPEAFADLGNEEETEDTNFDATPIERAAEALTGYVTVTAQVMDTKRVGDEKQGLRVVLRDDSGLMDLVAWDETPIEVLEANEGSCVVVSQARVEEYKGNRQLQVMSVTEVNSIQWGVGHAPSPDPGDDQGSLADTATDGGTVEDLEGVGGKVKTVLRNEFQKGDIVTVSSVAGKLSDESPDTVAETLADIAKKTRLLISEDDGYKVT